MDQNQDTAGRRRFLSAASSGLLILRPETVFGTQANSALAIGIIGCGGRGNLIGDVFVEYTGARVVALHDPLSDRLETTGAKFKVDAGRRYGRLAGYRDLIASNVDAVAIESPPYFHPEQAMAAVDAGKHVFLAKPVAVDVPGCTTVLDAARKAQGRLSFLVDFQMRVQPAFQEAAARVHRGEIGDPVLGHVFFHTSRLNPQPVDGLNAQQARLRHWVFDKVLSGDIIVEQSVHVIDTANWYIQSRPLRAHGTGGRKARVDVGDCWDHFLVNYSYPDGVKVDFSAAQFTRNYSDFCIRLYGSKGTVDSHYGGVVRILGENPWPGVEKDDTFRQGGITNVRAFAESIRSRKYLNNAAESVESNLASILGRIAAYRENNVTWDDMMRENEKLDAKLTD